MSNSSLQRQCFTGTDVSLNDAALIQRILTILMAQDGSTTRICESIARYPVDLELVRQAVVSDVPDIVREVLPGKRFIERVTSLVAAGQVLMDNLSYIALEGLPAHLQRDLEAGTVPIGHLLARLWVRRVPLPRTDRVLEEVLWSFVGLPDPAATRSYAITTTDGPLMVIAETYRRGMLAEFAGRR
jgi:chorismate-pyruvate lyase